MVFEYSLPKTIAGVRLPDTELAKDAVLIMLRSVPQTLFNYCLRTFVLGMIDARRRGLHVDVDVVFQASILHDLCLSPVYPGNPEKTFEENSGEFAAAFARASGISDRRAERIYQAILLHAGKAAGRSPDIEFVMHGARQDVVGPKPEELSDAQIQEIESALPRLEFKSEFLSILSDHVSRTNNPDWTTDFLAQTPPHFQDTGGPPESCLGGHVENSFMTRNKINKRLEGATDGS
ncbi:hypothetical protein [uncultured Roseobacter sp.]|uniref:hypothetical protein n=1 Tax=uncultured Roseobacter sp. TaxID=114847 RepID=UPI00262A326D|nr:hypothetical protein [uncultured Roseobacter sp.]